RDALAVLLAQALQRCGGARPRPHHLQRARHTRAGRKLAQVDLVPSCHWKHLSRARWELSREYIYSRGFRALCGWSRMPRGEFDRSERRARTRVALLEAASRVYARRGFDGATLDEIAEQAGFTKGAVYDHFGSKENLLFALLDEHLAAQIAEQVALF